ncbi:cupin domain-containing protein [Paraburkholderia ginsengisoli]|uniref:Cupin domain-containing protein n=1 Tax=Paraburkholderia ginsengisoli TaxID=311231 RepID=A0A7T4N660_9BURK|nr:cupin domain-containing protein [Paraburkholderia ginsengisoli]QQC65952.1 cupin domain-containing protein [Paraburkholderia ginsengisoli]
MSIEVATRLQYIRKKHGLSQRELAKRAGVTNGTISLIEQNRVSPSVGSLKKLLECIPMSLAEFFTLEVDAERSVVSRRADMPNLGNESIQFYLAGTGVKGRSMEILRGVYQPLSDTGSQTPVHGGYEGGVVVSGQIELTVDGTTWLLDPGDSYYFESRLPHRFRNPSAEHRCEIVSANSPPTF